MGSTSEVAGVFISSDEMDQVFARAEGPAHDDWKSEGLPTFDKARVRRCLKELREAVTEFIRGEEVLSAGSGENLAGFSSELGSLLLLCSDGGGPGKRKHSGKSRSRAKRGGSSPVPVVEVGQIDQRSTQHGTIELVVDLNVSHVQGTLGSDVTVMAPVLTGSMAIEKEPPVGGLLSTFVSCEVGKNKREMNVEEPCQARFHLDAAEPSCRIRLVTPSDASVRISAHGVGVKKEV